MNNQIMSKKKEKKICQNKLEQIQVRKKGKGTKKYDNTEKKKK